MKLATISLLSAALGVFLCWSALKTAQTIASVQVKREAILETN